VVNSSTVLSRYLQRPVDSLADLTKNEEEQLLTDFLSMAALIHSAAVEINYNDLVLAEN